MPQNRRGCHGTRHFIFSKVRGVPHSDVKARHFFFLRRVVGPRFKEARENEGTKDVGYT